MPSLQNSSHLSVQKLDHKQKADTIWLSLQNSANGGDLVAKEHYSLIIPLCHSPYLVSLIKRQIDFTISLLKDHSKDTIESLYSSVIKTITDPRPDFESFDRLSALLRQAKQKIALLTAFMDCNQLWSLDQVTWHLTDFADRSLQIAVAHAFHTVMKRGHLPWPNKKPEPVSPDLVKGSGYFILAMGKMGAGELNYSSDIDLIIFYDPEKITYTGKTDLRDCMIKISQKVIELMDRRTQYGYVFRTDMRLRPDPGSTPIAMTIDAALAYYHSHALNWERSAMIKARPAAGDLQTGQEFLQELSSWIWRKSMDYEAMGDILSIKNQINRHYDQREFTFQGYDVKLGQGGIREIEFFTQINQLLLGGRHPAFRTRGTLETLKNLASEDRISENDCITLTKAYQFFRRVEHHIQMINDEQNHTIPASIEQIKVLASFLGYQNLENFEQDVKAYSQQVTTIYDSLLPDGTPLETLSITTYDLEALLIAEGYADVRSVLNTVNKWMQGKYRAVQTNRAKKLVQSFLPTLLHEFAQSPKPESVIARFDRFLEQLPAGVQLFSMLQANPGLFKLLGRILGLAPALADTLSKQPSLWDAMLEPDFFDPLPDVDILSDQLKIYMQQCKDYQDILDYIRRWTHEKKFQVAIQTLEGIANIAESGPALTAIADTAIKALLPMVQEEFAQKHGSFSSGGLAMLAMGKYGGKELTFTSDLDVVFLYSVDDMTALSDGARPLSPSAYYSRLAQQSITAITALTSEGRLYEVDTRLRPSGNQGPLVVTLKTFQDYYSKAAWTWEHMALTRARIVYAPKDLSSPLMDTIYTTLSSGRDTDKLKRAVQKMRAMLFREFGSELIWNIKHTRGGLVDMEFIVQFLLLKHGGTEPSLFVPILPKAVKKLHDQAILTTPQSETILQSHHIQQTIQSILRISVAHHPKSSNDIPAALKAILLQVLNVQTFADVEDTLLQAQKALHAVYIDLIGDYLSPEEIPKDIKDTNQ